MSFKLFKKFYRTDRNLHPNNFTLQSYINIFTGEYSFSSSGHSRCEVSLLSSAPCIFSVLKQRKLTFNDETLSKQFLQVINT